MRDENETPTPKTIKALQVRTLRFERKDYYHPEQGFKATAELCRADSGYAGSMELKFELLPDMANEIMRVLAPIMAQQAAVEAQRLADESKALASALSDKLIEQATGK